MRKSIGTLIYRTLSIACLLVIASRLDFLNSENCRRINELEDRVQRVDSVSTRILKSIDSLRLIHPKTFHSPKNNKSSKLQVCKSGEFFGFLLYGRVKVDIHEDLEAALSNYCGPKVKITSLRRNWRGNSKHNHGKAVDFELNHELITYLCSEQGLDWLEEHDLKFYIEGKPKSKKIKAYESDPVYGRYVFFNKHATGDHVHMELI